LESLAKRRGEALKDYLIERGHVEARRLVVCAPAIEAEQGSLPRVEVSL
jgi:hypothetical protein